MNNVSLEVGTWVGGKAVPAFDMGATVSLNLISIKQAGFSKDMRRFQRLMNVLR